MHGSIPERDFKPNNLSDANKLEAGVSGNSLDGEDGDDASEVPADVPPYKIFGYFEPKGCFLERSDYSLYVFSNNNM